VTPCPGCGALFPPSDGPTHRYVGASAGCWALFFASLNAPDGPEMRDMLAVSRVPETSADVPPVPSAPSLEPLFGDAYGVQHHGDASAQAVQSVALHLLNLHGIISGRTTNPRWPIGRAAREKGVFRKLAPPALGSALTIRHLFPGGGVDAPATRSDYVRSVYDAWMALHRSTVEEWYERYVAGAEP